MADIFDELLGASDVDPAILAAKLRRDRNLGRIAELTGDKVLAPFGRAIAQEAIGSAQASQKARDTRQQAALKNALGAAALGFRYDQLGSQENRAELDRLLKENIAKGNWANRLEVAGLRNKGLKDALGGKSPQDIAREKSTQLLGLGDIIDQATAQTNWGSAGPAAALPGATKYNPFAANLKGLLDTISANLAFDQLNGMREQAALAGSRGSGLGQVTVREIELLSSKIASLEQVQSPDQLKQQLSRIKEHYDRVQANFAKMAEEGYLDEGGGAAVPQAAPSAPGSDVEGLDPMQALILQQILSSP